MKAHVRKFSQYVNESERELGTGVYEGKCMSEGMVAQLESMCESMCSEMKMVHEDSTQNTSHTYHREVNERLSKMLKIVESACTNCHSGM